MSDPSANPVLPPADVAEPEDDPNFDIRMHALKAAAEGLSGAVSTLDPKVAVTTIVLGAKAFEAYLTGQS